MSERGVFAIDRGIFEHPAFAPEPYTEREAWIWMIGAAAWKATRVRVGRHAFDLERGQLAFSTRFLAAKFNWSEARIRRFLKRLESDAMVVVSKTHVSTQITICNYDKYAFGRRTDDAPYDAPNDATATHSRRKEEKLKNLRKKESSVVPQEGDAWNSDRSKAKQASRPGRAEKAKTAWPEGFELDDDMRAFAAEHGWTVPTRQNAEFEKYHQHALQTGRLLKDWVAGWRSWVLKGAEFDGRNTRIAPAPVSTAGAAPIDWSSRVAKFKTNGLWPLPWGPQPGSAGCKAPPDVLIRHGYGTGNGFAFDAQNAPLVGGTSPSVVPERLREMIDRELLGGKHAAAGR
jgi:hypothetical protein